MSPERTSGNWPWSHLARQSELISQLAAAVDASETWRWLEICCSLAAGRGDELSDVDAAVGYRDVPVADLDDLGETLVHEVGVVVDVLVQVMPGSAFEARRFAVEFQQGAQLDLVVMPEARRVGLPTGAVAVVDKDGRLAAPWRPAVEDPPTPAQAREWLMLGWWAASDVAKYLQRGSLYEAVERLNEVRQQALRLYATGAATPFPSFGLVSLLDFPPYQVPDVLAGSYAVPAEPHEVLSAARATVDLLEEAARRAGETIGASLVTPWAAVARRRLDAVASRART